MGVRRSRAAEIDSTVLTCYVTVSYTHLRRSWARNEGAVEAIRREMDRTPGLRVTLPNYADDDIIRNCLLYTSRCV